MYRIAVRADSSKVIGIGHVMRCLTLVRKFKQSLGSCEVYFFHRFAESSAADYINADSFCLFQLNELNTEKAISLEHKTWLGVSQEEDSKEVIGLIEANNLPKFDLMIVDHYAIDKVWEYNLKDYYKKLLVIDDLGNRQHSCDYLLDQTFNCKREKYKNLVDDNTKMLLGTSFALLRYEFESYSDINRDKNRILVMFGGTDPDDFTSQTIDLMKELNSSLVFDVVISNSNVNIEKIVNRYSNINNFNILISPINIHELMTTATVAIGAVGTTSWERCASGLPALVVIQADNQIEIASSLSKTGVIKIVDKTKMESQLITTFKELYLETTKDEGLRERCRDICDGKGAERVFQEII